MILIADNRSLTRSARSTYLTQFEASGVSTLHVTNGGAFTGSEIVLIGEVGFEQSEIRVLGGATASTVTLSAPTSFAHHESVKVTVIPYDRVRYYWTAAASFSTSTPVGTVTNVTPDEWFTSITDSTHSTGYGWFVWDNSVTGLMSGHSNAIPYANFGRNTVKNALDSFFSLVNSNDRKLVTVDEAFEWLNEAYDEAHDVLGMAQSEFDASDGTDTFSVSSGTAEYPLPSDFSEMIDGSVTVEGTPIWPIDVAASASYADSSNTDSKWYVRGAFFGITPTPTSDFTVTYRYIKLPARLTSYSDTFSLPKTGYNCLKDWMLYRAKIKLKQADSLTFRELFYDRLNRLVAQSVNRDNSRDSVDVDMDSIA